MDKGIFRQYDIRGIVPDNFNSEIASKIANAIAIKTKIKTKNENPSVVVGRDVRLSSEDLFLGVVTGLIDAGCKVINIGAVPTPVTYFASNFLKSDAFIMITGSHNPPEYNGLKFGIDNETIHSEGILEIYEEIQRNGYIFSGLKGFIEKYYILDDYFNFYKNSFTELKNKISQLPEIKVIIDAGNGAASLVAPEIFKELGVKVIELFCEPDGRFPNHHPDPTVEKNLIDARNTLLDQKADFAFAYDGDADRIGILDEKGDIIWGDMLIYIYAKELKKRYAKPTIIADVKASQVLFDELNKLGIETIMWKTGHSLIKDKLKKTGAELAGEMSGHIFFKDRFFGFDDAIYASVRFLEAYVDNRLNGFIDKASDLIKDLPKVFNTPEIRLDCPDDKKFQIVDSLKNIFMEYHKNYKMGIKSIIDIDGIRVNFEHGWGLLRASNTQPVLVMRFEADTKDNMLFYQKIFQEELNRLMM
ncbi:MAG: phosphomannomutase/phosphoglucomutase [Deferribacterales bacterium]